MIRKRRKSSRDPIGIGSTKGKLGQIDLICEEGIHNKRKERAINWLEKIFNTILMWECYSSVAN